MKKNLLFGALFFASLFAAASGEEHGTHEKAAAIPWDQIGWQAANLGILLVVLFYASRKSVIEMFAKRKTDFIEQSAKTEALLVQAEAELKEIKTKLAQLESGEKKSLEAAQHEANLINANLIKESEAQALKLKNDAELSIQNELAKARAEINQLILKEAIAAAKSKLSNSTPQEQKAIENQFLAQVDQAQTAKAAQ